MVAFLSLFNFGLIPTQTTVLMPQHQSRGGGGGCGGGGGGGGSGAGGPSNAVGQKRARQDELEPHQKTLRKQLQRKLLKRSKSVPNRKMTQAMVEQAARDLEFVNAHTHIFREPIR